MKDPRRFYTYAYLREDRTPYYIGKGSGKRIDDNRGKPCKKPKDKSRIIFLKQNLTEEEAFKHEIYMIAVFGRIDLGTGILRNKTDGGDGSSGAIRSEECKRKLSEARKGENNYWYGKRGKDAIRYGVKVSVETRKKMSEVKKKQGVIPPSQKDKKWWNDGNGNFKKSIECPGEGWFLGREKNKKWWNDGRGNTKMSIECPGEGWVAGRGKRKKTNS